MEEDLSLFLEFFRVLGCEVMDSSVLSTLLFYLGVTLQIGFKTLGHIFALGNHTYASGQVFQNLRHEQRVMGTAEDDGVDLRVEAHDLVDALLDKVVGSRRVGLVVFDEGHPEGTGHARYLDVGVELVDLEVVALTLDGAFGGEDANVARIGEITNDLCCRTDDT